MGKLFGAIAFSTPKSAIAPRALLKLIAHPLSLALSLFLPSLETPDELIPSQSISSGKSSIDIPACSRSSFKRLICPKVSLSLCSPLSWRPMVLVVVPSSRANSSWVIFRRSRTCLRVGKWGLLFQSVSSTILISKGQLVLIGQQKGWGNVWGSPNTSCFPICLWVVSHTTLD